MGRLKRKRPASPKKRGRKKAARKSSPPSSAAQERQQRADVLRQDAGPAGKVATKKKETAKAIRPAGRTGGAPQLWAKSAQFLREVKIELKKVTWPTKKEAMASTVVVIILVFIVSAFLGLVDVGLSSLIRFILH